MKWTQLLKAFTQCASLTGVSRISGLMRDITCAHFFGAGAGFDAFLVAFQIPNFMRRLFAEGAMSQAFVPVLTECQHRYGAQRQQNLMNGALGTLIVAILMLSVVVLWAAPWVIRLYAPGFSIGDDSRFELAVQLLQWTFPYLLMISMTAFFAAILNCQRRFMVTSAAPILLNLSLISGAWWGGTHGQTVWALGLAVPIAGVLQLLCVGGHMMRTCGLVWPTWGGSDPGVRKMWRLMLGALFGVSVAQIGLVIDTFLASFLTQGSVSWLYFSQRLVFLPLGLFGVAAATVVLPRLSNPESAAHAQDTMAWAVSIMLVLGVPAAFGLAVLSKPIVMTLFFYGAFDWQDVLMTQKSLITLSLGLPAFMLIKVFASGFYARQDVKTPVKLGVYGLCLNVVLCLILMRPLAHAGLTLAASLSAWFQAILLGLQLSKLYSWQVPWSAMLRVFLSSMGMCFVLWVGLHLTSGWQLNTVLQRVGVLFVLIGIGLVAYTGMLWIVRWKLPDMSEASPGLLDAE